MNSAPLMPQVGVIALVPDTWGPVWQPRHQVVTRLAKYFHVVWIEPSVPWRSALKGPAGAAPVPHYHPVPPSNFLPCVPERWLPNFGRPVAMAQWVYGTRIRRAHHLLAQSGCSKFVLYLWRPEFDLALDAMPFDFTCYHIDDEYSFSASDVPNSEREERLIRRVDHVFVHSPGLLEKKGSINSNTSVCPNGVDFDAYARPSPEPDDIARIPRPRIGYTGYLKDQLDWNLVGRLAEARTDWQFVFIGPLAPHPETKATVRRLTERANTHFLGPKPVWELASYPQHFDVCIMPYRRTSYTDYIYPLKLHEYLASGAPVVASRIRSLTSFDSVITLADSEEDWLRGISAAVEAEFDRPALRHERQLLARSHDWAVLVEGVARIMAKGLDIEFVESTAR